MSEIVESSAPALDDVFKSSGQCAFLIRRSSDLPHWSYQWFLNGEVVATGPQVPMSSAFEVADKIGEMLGHHYCSGPAFAPPDPRVVLTAALLIGSLIVPLWVEQQSTGG